MGRPDDQLTDRARGCLLGLACGDALGRPVEFATPERIERTHGRVTEMLGDGTHGKPAGTITDDTEMALCVARSLAQLGEFDGADVARRFVEWYESGPFDIGLMTREAIASIRDGTPWDEAGRAVWERKPEGQNAGNGSIMRCSPHAIRYREDPERLVTVSRESSAITHADPRCTWGCAVLNLVLAALLRDESDPLEGALGRVDGAAPTELLNALEPVADAYDATDLVNSGYVVHTLQAGLHYGLGADTAEDAIVEAVNMGGDADTIGAVTGAVAGARFGASALPERWVSEIDEAEEIRGLADRLAAF
ncbi:ADP-ribosylglycohydrolase family protein [Halospeciosus flavus]|uniref:ADP-ribosylglycohydrolase family protein n=1 Tax=Halospeciosus flavus TaxID=3032283 RepID=A0ABD5Z3M3_9EURY|nr:ADP-ribosylglycohydrolase family protein [Halospeciosus flavus]